MRRNIVLSAAAIIISLASSFLSAAEPSPKRFVALNAKAGAIGDLIDLLKVTEIGADVAKDFAPKLQSGDIRIVDLTKKVRKDYEIPRNEIARFDLGTARVYVDFDQEAGLLAPVLLHELVHAVDPALSATKEKLESLYDEKERLAVARAKSGLDRAEKARLKGQLEKARSDYESFRQLRMFKSERKAFDAEFAFRKQLWTKVPGYLPYLQSKEAATGTRLTENPSDEELMSLYQIDPGILSKALQEERSSSSSAGR